MSLASQGRFLTTGPAGPFTTFFLSLYYNCFHISSPLVVSFLQVKVKVAQSCPTLCDPESSRPKYWSGLPFPFPGERPNPGIESRSPALQVDSLPAEPPEKPMNTGVDRLSLSPADLLTQESSWGLLHCRWILYHLGYDLIHLFNNMGLSYYQKIFNFIFNWRIIALQCCVGFYHTRTSISRKYIYVPSLFNLPPTLHPGPPHSSRLSQSTGLSFLRYTAASH